MKRADLQVLSERLLLGLVTALFLAPFVWLMATAYKPAMDLITSFAINWNIVSCATPAWARTVFPNLLEEEAVARLWDAIFAASRIDAPKHT